VNVGAPFLIVAAFAGPARGPRRLRFREIATHRGLVRLAVSVAAGLGIGALIVLRTKGAVGIAGGLATSAPYVHFCQAAGFLMALGTNSPQAIGPRDVIRADGRYGLLYGLFFVPVFFLFLDTATSGVPETAANFVTDYMNAMLSNLARDPVGAVTRELATGSSFGLTFALARGASSWIRYHVSVVVNAVRGRGPLRYGADRPDMSAATDDYH
jgi:hypothetical protein